MKPTSVYFGSPKETTTEKFAWWPVRSSFSKKRIWFKKYVELESYYDDALSHPIRSNTFKFIYSEKEYILYLLRKNEALH